MARADLIYGNGNDRIYGGPGADVISCGAGRDVVYADARDTVARDCEVVKGLKPSPPPPPPPPPPAAPLVPPGHYLASSIQGRYTSFDVAADRSFSLSVTSQSGDSKLTMQGRFDASGNVAGTFQSHFSTTQSGTRYECDSGVVGYTGRHQ